MIRLIILLSVNFVFVSASAQWKILTSITLASQITSVAVDRPGEFYIVDDQQTVRKYDSNGHLLRTAQFKSRPVVFDPHDGARLFAFFADHSVANLSPSLTITRSTGIDSAYAIHAFLVCPAGDYRLLILDSADWSIKKINVKTENVIAEYILPDSITTSSHFTSIREYQNFVFLLDRNKGIHILNSMGRLLKTIEAKGLKGFNFLGEELYYVDDTNLKFFDLFTAETRSQDLPYTVDFALITDERLLTARGKQVQIFATTP
jgi:hypothetical protein